MPKSASILGRPANRLAFREGRAFTVSMYKTYRGDVFYTGPVGCKPKNPKNLIGRIRVTRKKDTSK